MGVGAVDEVGDGVVVGVVFVVVVSVVFGVVLGVVLGVVFGVVFGVVAACVVGGGADVVGVLVGCCNCEHRGSMWSASSRVMTLRASSLLPAAMPELTCEREDGSRSASLRSVFSSTS